MALSSKRCMPNTACSISGGRILAWRQGKRLNSGCSNQDATVNLHNRMYGIRNGEVEEVFTIER